MADFDSMRTRRRSFAVPNSFPGVNNLVPGAESDVREEQETPNAPDMFAPAVTGEQEVQQSGLEALISGGSSEPDSAGFSETSSDTPGFTVVNVEDNMVSVFAKEYTSVDDVVGCVADVNMLLSYMIRTERTLGVTLSFEAYGIDPIVFEQAAAEIPDGQPRVVAIPAPGREVSDDYMGDLYELIEIDGHLYLSCVSESLNKDYLHQVIAEATEAVVTHGRYIYTLVGPRPLRAVDGAEQKFVNTLKLNSYELSVLLSYMSKVDGVRVTHGIYGGCAAIMFER